MARNNRFPSLGRIVVFLLFFSLQSSGFGQTPEQFSSNAAAFAERGATPVIVVRQSVLKDQWVKLFTRIIKATWDVKKTDSLLQPVVAVVKVELQTGVSSRLATKEQAEQVELVQGDFETETIDLQYVPSPVGWVFSKGQHFNKILNQSFEIKQPGVNATFSSNGWLIRGFSVMVP